MTNKILALVDDLFFSAKISNTALHCGVTVEVLSSLESLLLEAKSCRPAMVIVDLNGKASRPLEAVQALKSDPVLAKIPMIAFYSHVQTELMNQARQAGCDNILPRSAFSRNLAAVLTEYSSNDKPHSPMAQNASDKD